MRQITPEVLEIAEDVFTARGTHVNYLILREGADITLIDAGWPRDVDGVERALGALGHRPEDVRAILLTHAHIDHAGGTAAFHDRHGTPVLAHPREVGHARGERRESAGPLDVVVRTYKPQTMRWAIDIMRAGALTHAALPYAEAFPVADQPVPLDLPGRPVPVLVTGHTSGHTAFHLPDTGVVATGDALVTGHPLSGKKTPQLLPEFFATDPAEATRTLDALAALDADVLAPGHGAPLIIDIARAVEIARA
ncbi:MBL fold metallo-hydrolase [Tsukamurella soli]|uniref:MBL fold metallo-hydrolase n=1 Tax=Tsukamurella soli TaxID=644556 RepID=A0ABP8J8X2_9ACTN